MTEPTIDQLRAFCAVVEERSFVAAARKSHLSQPHVSRMVQELERRIGVQLLIRSSQGVDVTPAGQVMYEESTRTLTSLTEGIRRVLRTSNEATTTLIVGFVTSVHPQLLQELSTEFANAYPGGRLQLREMHSAEQARQLVSGEIAAGILRPPIASREIESAQLYTEQLVAVVPAVYAVDRVVALDDLAAFPVVVYGRYLGGAPVIAEQALAAAGVRPRVVAEAPSTQVLIDLLGNDLGVALVPESTVRGLIYDERIHSIQPPVHCNVVISWRADDTSPAVAALLQVAVSRERPWRSSTR